MTHLWFWFWINKKNKPNRSICNSAIGNWHIYSLNFFPRVYILKDTKFLYYKALKLFLLYIKHWKNPAVKFKCNFPTLCYLHSTTPFDSFILSLTKQDFSCKWPYCFWELLLAYLFCTVCLYSESNSERKVIVKGLVNGRYFEKFLFE